MEPFTEDKPWGWFRVFGKNEPATIKILHVNQGEEFSLQKHAKREEFWRVLSGHPNITIGDKIISAGPGEEFVIEVNTLHRIEAGDETVEILEISKGKFDEKDVVRLKDDYGRA